MWLSTTKLAKQNKVTSQTIRRWIDEGKYEKYERTEGGHYRVWVQQPSTVVLYARVSSSKQLSSIETQQRLLQERYPNGAVISDVGSGFNFKRKGFTSILERSLRGESITLVATTSDRITRTGFQLIQRIIELSGGRIELLEEDLPSENFDVSELVAYITSFCNSFYGKRSRKRNKEKYGYIQ